MEAPRITDIGPNLCGSCYPGPGDPNVYCESCFRRLAGELDGNPAPRSTGQIVDQMFERVVPRRQHAARPSDLIAELINIDPLTTPIVLTGPSGRGKSFQIAASFYRGIEFAASSGRPPVSSEFQWVTVLGVLEQIKATFGKQTDHPIVEQLKAARMLHLEDIGTTSLVDDRKTDWAYGVLMDVIDYRHANLRPTAATTNLTLAQLEEKVGARIVGRLVEDAVVHHLTGEQRRAPRNAA